MKPIELVVTYTMKPGQRENFMEAVKSQGVLAKIQAEPGCVRYEYCVPTECADQLLLLESWADEAALKTHFSSPGMQELKQLKGVYILETLIREAVPKNL